MAQLREVPSRSGTPAVTVPVGASISRARAGWWSSALARSIAVLAGVSALITVLATLRAGFYYDDFWNLDQAHELGWGWDFLGRPVFGHVTPGANVIIGLVAGPGGGHWFVAAFVLVVLAALVPVAATLAARALGAEERPALVAGALAAAGSALASGSTWWSAGLNIYPSVLAGCAVVGGYGWARSGQRRGVVLAALGLLVGLSFTEGAAVFLVVPVVLALAPAAGRPGRLVDRLALAWGDRRAWLVVLAPLLVMLVVRASASGPLGSDEHPPLASLIGFTGVFLGRGFVPSLVGLTTGRVELLASPVLTVIAGVVGVVLVGAVLRPRLVASKAAVALVAVALVVAARGLLVAWSRLELLGWDRAVEVRYWADLLWLVPVLLAPAWQSQPATDAEPSVEVDDGDVASAPGGWGAIRGPIPIALGAVVLAGLLGQAAIAAQAPSVTSAKYVAKARSSWAARPAGAVALDTAVPYTVLGPQFGASTFLSRTVAHVGVDLDFEPADALVAPDDSGRFRPVTLGPLTTLAVSQAFTAVGAPGVAHDGPCWVAGPAGALVWVPLARPVTNGSYVLDLAMAGPSDPDVALLAAGSEPSRYVGVSGVGRGEDRWIVATAGFQGTQLGFEMGPGARLCLASGAVSLPVAEP